MKFNGDVFFILCFLCAIVGEYTSFQFGVKILMLLTGVAIFIHAKQNPSSDYHKENQLNNQ